MKNALRRQKQQAMWLALIMDLQWRDQREDEAMKAKKQYMEGGWSRPGICVACPAVIGLQQCATCGCWWCSSCHQRMCTRQREDEAWVQPCLWCQGLVFDATKGFPGEGPPSKQVGPPKDLSARVTPVTRLRYEQRYLALCQWAAMQSFPPFDDLIAAQQWQALDSILSAYIQFLHNSGEPTSHGSYTLAAFHHQWPEAQGKLPRCWLCQRQWGRLAPGSMRCPMPLPVMLAMAVAAWVKGSQRMAIALVIAFLGLMRPAEVSALRRCHPHLAHGLVGSRAGDDCLYHPSEDKHKGTFLPRSDD